MPPLQFASATPICFGALSCGSAIDPQSLYAGVIPRSRKPWRRGAWGARAGCVGVRALDRRWRLLDQTAPVHPSASVVPPWPPTATAIDGAASGKAAKGMYNAALKSGR
jgi:hypothetical protein